MKLIVKLSLAWFGIAIFSFVLSWLVRQWCIQNRLWDLINVELRETVGVNVNAPGAGSK